MLKEPPEPMYADLNPIERLERLLRNAAYEGWSRIHNFPVWELAQVISEYRRMECELEQAVKELKKR